MKGYIKCPWKCSHYGIAPRSYDTVEKEKDKHEHQIRCLVTYDMFQTPNWSSAETRQKLTVMIRTSGGSIIKTVL